MYFPKLIFKTMFKFKRKKYKGLHFEEIKSVVKLITMKNQYLIKRLNGNPTSKSH